ncbi:MAG: DinB family protein [Dehalococcoidia bacterium]
MSETSQRFLLKALHEAGNEIASAFYRLDERELGLREREDGWTLRQLCCHLRDAELDYQAQLETVLNGHPRRKIKPVDLDLLVEERCYDAADVESTLYEYSRLRSDNCYTLAGLWAEDWERSAPHPYRGAVSIDDIAHEMNEHDLEHIWQIRRIREAGLVGRR